MAQMFVCDVNILIALFRQDHPHHADATQWWDSICDNMSQLHIPDIVWVGFLRIVTNSKVFKVPSSMSEATEFMSSMRQYSQLLTISDSQPILDIFVDICLNDQVRGNLVTDAWIAACAKNIAAPIVSFDRDFLRFSGVKVVDPKQAVDPKQHNQSGS